MTDQQSPSQADGNQPPVPESGPQNPTPAQVPQAQFVYERRVNFADTDTAGIVHFSNYYRYMEEAEHAYFRSLGLTIMKKRADGVVIGWPRVSSQCQYLAPAFYDNVLLVHVNLERLGYKSLTWHMTITHEGRKLSQGRMKTACCLCYPDHRLESIPIPEDYTSRLTELP